MHEEVILTIRDLSFFYEEFQALKDINLDFREKSVTALIGPSGCGKSTFLRTLNRMNDVIEGIRVEGSVIFDGKDVYREHDEIELRMRIGMVFQKPNPFPMSIFDNVAYGPRLHGKYTKKQLAEIVEKSLKGAALWEEVKDSLTKSAFSISGGQQQRLCIARALAVEPEIVLMDEPTSALDPISTARIEDLIDELKQNYTIIIVTHNMQQAGRISDNTAFFLHGIMEEVGTTEQIFFNPVNSKTEAYLSGKFG